MSLNSNNLILAAAQATLGRLQHLHIAIEAFSPYEFSQVFNLPIDKRDSALRRLQQAIAEKEAHIHWLKTTHPIRMPAKTNAAWSRHIAAVRAQGGNCD